MISNLRRKFFCPDPEFTPFPFWFWNDELNEGEIRAQIRDFKEHGVDGFVLHPRLGMPREIPYLSPEYFSLVRAALEEARSLKMKVILYDEGMYPSGSANGQVVRLNPAYASRGIWLFTAAPAERKAGFSIPLGDGDECIALIASTEIPGGKTPGSTFNLSGARLISSPGEAGSGETVYALIHSFTRGTIRGIHAGQDDNEWDAPASTDLLNEEAVQCFIRLTHERYYQEGASFFGDTIIGMFTDEPNIMGRGSRAHKFFPWTPGFEDDLRACSISLTELPALYLDAGDRTGEIRSVYQDAVHGRLKRSFYKPISLWCEARGIALTGHPESSEDIGLLDLFHIPGQDIVWRWVAPENALETPHSAAAKCASDAARHSGKKRNLNEVFGCCGPLENPWSFTAGDMKWYLDYLFVRGCNLISPHAFYYSLRTELQYNERPPDIGPGNIWWPFYRKISAYIKRMSFLMTGINQTRIAVLTGDEELPVEIVRPLYENQIEFNYLNRSALFRARVENGLLRLEDQGYCVVLVEDEKLLDAKAMSILAPFERVGGSILRLGNAPYQAVLASVLRIISPEITALIPCRDLRLTHVVLEGCHCVLLVNEGANSLKTMLSVNLEGIPEIWDPWNLSDPSDPVDIKKPMDFAGTTNSSGAFYRDQEKTIISLFLEPRESRVLIMNPVCRLTIPRPPVPMPEKGILRYSLSFDWKGAPGIARLDLGKAGAQVEITVNDVFSAALLWEPWRLEIPVREGENKLDIRVWESMANRYGLPIEAGLLADITIEGAAG